jgi:ribosomal-protein-alanine N-acetyltransferase
MYDSPLLLETERLFLAIPGPDWATALASYRERNTEHLLNAGPSPLLEVEAAAKRLRRAQNQFHEGSAVALLLFAKESPELVIGSLTFDRIVRGPMRGVGMGYGLDHEHEGHGFMSEAASRAIAFMFEEWGMHRIEADYQPSNGRSGRLLRRLGFAVEGYARDYLFINGVWRDHVKTALNRGDNDPPPDRDPVTAEPFPLR